MARMSNGTVDLRHYAPRCRVQKRFVRGQVRSRKSALE